MADATSLITALAADIRREHEAAERAFANAVEHAIRCGQLLNEAKQELPHGGWLPWLDDHFPASRRTAQGYMRLARRAEDAQALAHLGIEGALRMLAAPKPSSDEEQIAALAARLDSLDGVSDRDERLAAARAIVREATLGREAAESYVDHSIARLRADLRYLHDHGAHTALGYASWVQFIEAQFPMPEEWDDEFRDTMRSLLFEPQTPGVA